MPRVRRQGLGKRQLKRSHDFGILDSIGIIAGVKATFLKNLTMPNFEGFCRMPRWPRISASWGSGNAGLG
jgi:hypothetical protein